MVQVLSAKPGFGSKFSQAFNPSFQQGLSRFLDESAEEDREKRKAMLDQQKEERLLGQKKATAKGLGLPEEAIEPSVQAALLKEQARDKRNQALLERLGGGIGQNGGSQEAGGLGPIGGLSDTDILGIGVENPQIAQLLQRQKEANEKLNMKREETERKPIEKSVESFFNKIQEDQEKIPGLELSLESMLDAVQRGDVDPFSSAHIADIATAFGAPESLTRAFQTPGSKEFNTARKSFLSSTLKDAFRGATTGKEIELAESLLAQVGVKPEANQAALFLLQSDLMVRQEKVRLTEEAREKGISNYKIPEYVNKNLKPFQKQLSTEYIEAIRELSKKK